MGYLNQSKIKGQIDFKNQGNVAEFFNSMTSSPSNKKYFNVSNDTANFRLVITSITKEDGSGKKFIFKAIGEVQNAVHKTDWKKIESELKGYISF